MIATSYKIAKTAVKVGSIGFGILCSSMMSQAVHNKLDRDERVLKTLFTKKSSQEDIPDEEVFE